MKGDWEKLIELDKQGFFPALGEEAEPFLNRVSALHKFQEDTLKQLKETGKFSLEGLLYHADELLSEADLMKYQNQSKEKYQFQLNYVPAFYSSRGLNFLFGGMAISFEDTENKYKKGEIFSIFQLRKTFREKEKFLIYTRSEIISHEVCHVARAPLHALEYEEYFAYQTSDSVFRRFVSPMLWRGSDMVILMLSLLVVFFGQLYSTFWAHEKIWYFYGWLPFSFYLLFLTIRSFFSRKKLNRFRNDLISFCKKPEFVDAVLFRLSDNEIQEASKATHLETFITQQNDLRWQIIKHRFLK